MKKYLLAIFTLFVIYNLTSASNWDLLKPGKRWNVILTGLSPDGKRNDTTTYFYKFDEDTIINTYKYRRAWESTDVEFKKRTLNGFVREDSLNCFYFMDINGYERMLYKNDLNNLHIGDSIIIKSYIKLYDVNYLVVDIDSLQIEGKYKKRYTLQQSHHTFVHETWIEGIGSSFGILQSGLIGIGGTFELLCYYEKDAMIYRNPDYSECYYPTIKTALQSVRYPESQINVFSSSNHNIINIKSQVDNSVRIYNSCGMYVETFNVLANQEYSLNVSSYPKGIYFVSTSTNLSGSKKFIKY
ncbi:MAG TPA: T9SS type A sorting domain-containing protein [Paludibacter sp.]|nr:T9SS type A sorting domain-containing protein [Paludibacter sp.]